MRLRRYALVLAGLAAMAVAAGCGGAHQGPTQQPMALALASVVVQRERTPVERKLDGIIEAVNQGCAPLAPV
jgi:hypothetical protein